MNVGRKCRKHRFKPFFIPAGPGAHRPAQWRPKPGLCLRDFACHRCKVPKLSHCRNAKRYEKKDSELTLVKQEPKVKDKTKKNKKNKKGKADETEPKKKKRDGDEESRPSKKPRKNKWCEVLLTYVGQMGWIASIYGRAILCCWNANTFLQFKNLQATCNGHRL